MDRADERKWEEKPKERMRKHEKQEGKDIVGDGKGTRGEAEE